MFIEIIPDPSWEGERTYCVAVEHIARIKSTNYPFNSIRIELTNGVFIFSHESYESFKTRLNELTQKS